MPYYPYQNTSADLTTLFAEGITSFELKTLQTACGKHGLTTALELALKRMTGCATFLEFRKRVLSPHTFIDPDQSLVLIEEVQWTSKVRMLAFKALMMSSEQHVLVVTTRRLNYPLHDDVSGWVQHNLMYVNPAEEYRGKGLGTVVVQSHEDAWEVAGYAQVKLTASEITDSETLKFGPHRFKLKREFPGGRTLWGQHGYDFDPDHSAEGKNFILDSFRKLVEHARDNGTLDTVIAENILAQEVVPPWQMQTVVALPDQPGGKPRLLGDEALARRDWYARKFLNPEDEGYAEGQQLRLKYLRKHPYR